MKKDKEWLKNEILGLSIKARHKENNQREWHMGHEMALFDVNKLIDQLDEPEKPVIPQFVANFIRATKPNNSLRLAFEYIAQQKIDNYDDGLAFWIEEGNSELFASAWIDGYEVEKEKKYRIKFSDNQYASRFNDKKINNILTDEEFAAQYTEAEIKKIDERLMIFAEDVEE